MTMKKKLLTLTLAGALMASVATTALAHDGWSQTNAPIIAAGEVSYVELLMGNHSNHHASYRIDGKWSLPTTKVYVTNPAGVKTDITSTIFYTGEEKEVSDPGKNNYFVSSFSSSNPGAYIVSVEGDSVFKHGDVASRTLRSAKSFVAVSDVPTANRVAFLKGFSKPVSIDRAELVPLFNPAAVKPNQKVDVQLLMRGKPAAGIEVSLIRRSNSDATTLTTDANGVISFLTGPADYYLLRAKPSTDEKEAGKFDKTNYEATMTFTVQNVRGLAVEASVNPVPVLYWNGARVDHANVQLVDGKTVIDGSFLKANLGVDAAGAVELRKTAEAAGAAVEYLAAEAGLRAAVHVYTKN